MSTPIVRRRKKAVEVDTIQWTGHNLDEVIDFTGGDFLLVDADEGTYSPDVTAKVFDDLHDTWVGVKTGQHIVRGIQGELYPIAEAVLAETYEDAGTPLHGSCHAEVLAEAADYFERRRPSRAEVDTDFQRGRRATVGWVVEELREMAEKGEEATADAATATPDEAGNS